MANEPQNTSGPAPKADAPVVQASVDASSLLESTPELEVQKQVAPTTVIYVPRKDFEARVNQDVFQFRAGIPTKVTRDVAAMLEADPDRGYVRD